MAFCIAAGVFIRLPLLSPLSCSFSHPIRFRAPNVVAESKVFWIQKEKNQVIKRFKAIMYLKSGSWPEISDIEFNLLKYAQEATPLLAKLSKSFNEKYRKKGVHGLYTMRFSVAIAALAAQVFAT